MLWDLRSKSKVPPAPIGSCEAGRGKTPPGAATPADRFRRGSMSKSEPAELNEFGTADEPTATNDDLEPRAECWCADEDLACFDHYMAERNLRGEF